MQRNVHLYINTHISDMVCVGVFSELRSGLFKAQPGYKVHKVHPRLGIYSVCGDHMFGFYEMPEDTASVISVHRN